MSRHYQSLESQSISEQDSRASQTKHSRTKSVNLLIVTYLIIRIVLSNVLSLLPAGPNVLIYRDLIEFGLFLSLAGLIWLKRSNLSPFHFDAPSLILLGLSATLIRTFYSDQLFIWLLFALWITVTLLVGVRVFRSQEHKANLQSTEITEVLMGAAIGALLAGLIAIPRLMTNSTLPFNARPFPHVLGIFLLAFLTALTHSAVMEEPFFRGFLWGKLVRVGWAEWKVFLAQAVLFWIAHIRLIDTPYSFFVTVPLGGLVFGAIAWRTKSLTPAILAHTIYNATSSII